MSVVVRFDEAVASVAEGIDPMCRDLVDVEAVVREVFTETAEGWVRSGDEIALILATSRHSRPALQEDGLYLTFDRLVCGRVMCAGSAAVATGVDLHGCPVVQVTSVEAREFVRLGVPVLTCECGEVSREAGQVRG